MTQNGLLPEPLLPPTDGFRSAPSGEAMSLPPDCLRFFLSSAAALSASLMEARGLLGLLPPRPVLDDAIAPLQLMTLLK